MFDNVARVNVVILVCVLLVNCYNHTSDLGNVKVTYLTVAEGESAVLNCEVDFPQVFPIPYKVVWRRQAPEHYVSPQYVKDFGERILAYREMISWRDGQVHESDRYIGRVQRIENQYPTYGRATINLTSVRESDAGWIHCKVTFPNREPPWRDNGTWYYLTVVAGNLLAIPPINKTVQEGEEAQFYCRPKDEAIKVRWFKESIPLEEYHDLMTRSWVTKDNTLVIKTTDSGDLGEFMCEATSPEGEKQNVKAYLNVQYKAKVVYAPPEIHLPYGRPAMIDCHFRSNPGLTNLRWEKDGFLFDPYNVQGVYYRMNGSLYISKVDETHGGTYTCTPYNDLGTAGPSPNMRIIVQRPPIFVKTPHNLYLKKLGETIEMPCDARDGDNGHRPLIVWYRKDGTSLPVGRYSIKDGNLTIIDIRSDDRGVYQCSATNKAATISAETELLVENIPSSAPYNITTASSTTSVHITWWTGRQRANVDYSIWYRKRGNDEWKTYSVPSTKVLEATVANLEPGTEYEFMVLCKGDDGEGFFSKSVRVWTKNVESETERISGPFPPIGYPKHVAVKPVLNGLLVTWEPPEYGIQKLRAYAVRWSQGPDESIFGSAETTNTSYIITNLAEGNEYDIQVLALTVDDQQAVAEKIKAVFPGYKSIRAIATGIIAGLAFLAVTFVAVYYVKKKWFKPYQGNTKN